MNEKHIHTAERTEDGVLAGMPWMLCICKCGARKFDTEVNWNEDVMDQSFTTPPQPDVKPTPEIIQRCAKSICDSFAVAFQEQGIVFQHEKSREIIEQWIGKCVDSQLSDHAQLLAEKELEIARLNKLLENRA